MKLKATKADERYRKKYVTGGKGIRCFLREAVRGERVWLLAGCIGVFLFLLYFFLRVHPVTCFDSDDWYYMGIYRKPVPIWGSQNPIKAFPDFFMPVTDKLASWLIYPFTQNVFLSISVFDGILLSILILTYLIGFLRLVYRQTNGSAKISLVVSLLFLVFHFALLRSAETDNLYLFYSLDQTNYFNYLIPSVMNTCIALSLMREDLLTDFFSKRNKGKKLFFLVAAYFCIFSNVTACITSAAYVGCSLLSDLFQKQGEKLTVFLKRRSMKLIYLGVWGLAQIFEVNGNRAAQLSEGAVFSERFTESVQGFSDLLKTVNPAAAGILLLSLLFFGGVLFYYAVRKKTVCSKGTQQKEQSAEQRRVLNGKLSRERSFLYGSVLLSGVLNYIYMLLISSKAGSWYITRPDATFGIFAYLLIFILLLLAEGIKRVPKAIWAVPALTLLLILQTETPEKTFQDSNRLNADASLIQQINDDEYNQIMTAYTNGEQSLELLVPDFSSGDNWPLATYSGSFYIYGLYNMGQVQRYMEVTVVPAQEKNLQFDL